jgi:hypothetical protein
MSDLLAAVRLLEENISYAEFLVSAQSDSSRKALYEEVKNHLKGDLIFIEQGIRTQLAVRQKQDADIAAEKEKALAEQEYKERKDNIEDLVDAVEAKDLLASLEQK